MSTIHRIDELIFDCSFDSMAIANEYESEMNAWLTARLLPAIDAILNEFDEAESVLCLDHIEIDLGNISNDDFYVELIRRLQETLSEKLRAVRKSDQQPELESPGILPVKRFSKIQSDLEKLQDFLLTGSMPWHIDKADAQVHEKMLQQVLHEAGGALVVLLKRTSESDRVTLIKRLVSQFSQHHLENLLSKIVPTHVHLLLDFLMVYRFAVIESGSVPGTQTEWVDTVWVKLFEFMLDDSQLSADPVALLGRFVKKMAVIQMQDPVLLLQKISLTAKQFVEEGKIRDTLYVSLEALHAYPIDLTQVSGVSEEDLVIDTYRSGDRNLARSVVERLEKDGEAEQAESTTIQPTTEAARQTGAAAALLYLRLVTALRKAELIELESTASNSPESRIAILKQQLRDLLRSPELRTRLASSLPEATLLDIFCLLAPQIAALMEQLLAQAALLYRWPASTHRNAQKHWKQQIWAASLTCLQTGTDSGTEPAAYIQAIAQSLSGTADSQMILRAWHDALDQSKTFGTLHTILQTFQENAPSWNETTGRTADIVTEQSEASTAYWKLHQRLTTGKQLTEQQDISAALEELAMKHPAQLQRIYQDLRSGRYDLTATPLNAAELRHLVAMLLKTESSIASADRRIFQEAIETQANQVSDQQQPYYRKLLEDLLQGREIDLEAIAKMAQRTVNRNDNNNPDRSKAAEAEPTDTQSTTRPERKSEIQTTHTALYLRILAALHKAKLVETESAVSATAEVQVIALKQQLRDLIRSPELRIQLVNKLPQPILLDITYLLAPQMAALIEQLLTQGDKLYQSSGTTGSSTLTHWKQQIWMASLAYLVAEADSNTEPIAYIEVIAHSLSGEADSQVILRAWHEALGQGKASGTLHTILQALLTSEPQWNWTNATREEETKAKGTEGIKKAEQAESTTIQPTTEAARQTGAAAALLYLRLVTALRKAELIELESTASNSPESRIAILKQQLRDLLRSPELRTRLASSLPEATLLDIFCLLAPQIAALMEQLLAQAALLYRWPASTHRNAQKHWKQQIWAASLTCLQTGTDSGTEPAAYIQAIAQSLSGTADSQMILRAWHDALDQSKTFGTLHTILQTFQENAPSWNETTGRTADIVTEQSEASTAYWKLHQRLTTGKQLTEQQDISAALEELAMKHPAQLQRIYQDLRSGRYDLTATPLNAAELRHLVAMLLKTESSIASADRRIFQEAIETQANQVSDQQQPYYRKLLEDLLQGREIDLEAIAKMAQRTVNRNDNNNPDRSKAAEAEPTDTQSTTRPERKSEIQTTHTALYLRILAALHKAKLVETESAVSATAEVQVIALKQQLRDLIRSPELRIQLVNKLPQPILLDITYLLAPQMAALIEQLLTQGDKLYQSSGTTGSSTLTHWKQQIWMASLAYLVAEADSNTEPIAYIEVIAHSLSGEADSQVILRAWHEALGQGKASGTLHTILQALLTSEPQWNWTNATREEETKAKGTEGIKKAEQAESTTIQPTTEAARQTGAAAALLYLRLVTALRKAELIELESTASNSPESRIAILKQQLRDLLRSPELRTRLASSLPEATLLDIFCLLAPQIAALMEQLLAQAALLYRWPASTHRNAQKHWKQQIWAASLTCLQTGTDSGTEPAAYIQAIAQSLSGTADSQMILRAWHDALDQSKTFGTLHTILQTLILNAAEWNQTVSEQKMDLKDPAASYASEESALIDFDALLNRAQSTDVFEEIYIDNAGQVLAAPYFPRLFTMLKLVEGGAFVDRRAAERAAHLLQFMVNEQTQSPEYQLTLNKILCGISTGIPICREIDISENEEKTIEGLMHGMIQNWKAIGNTSIGGLRETFLQRKGKLQLKEDGMWYLTIEPGVFDMLLDSLPWSFSVIKHAWMDRAVHVSWR